MTVAAHVPGRSCRTPKPGRCESSALGPSSHRPSKTWPDLSWPRPRNWADKNFVNEFRLTLLTKGYRLRAKLIGPLIRGWKYWVAPALSALLIAYFAVSFGSHAIYNMQDVAGFTCRPSAAPKKVGPKGAIVRFQASELCYATGLTLVAGQRYRIRIDPGAAYLQEYKDAEILPAKCDASVSPSLFNGSVQTDERGYTTFPSDDNQSLSFAQSAVHFFLLPFRRSLDRSWFLVIVRYGSVGGEERYLDPDRIRRENPIEAPLVSPFDAELFLFLNDATLGIPGLYDIFYRDNKGCVTAFIRS